MRSIILSCHILVLFRVFRDNAQIIRLGAQLFPKKGDAFYKIYNWVMASDQYGYLFIDQSPQSIPRYAIRTKIFTGEHPIIFQL